MFEELPMMVFFCLISIIVSYLVLRYFPPPFKKFFIGLAVIGIVIHELCHLLMCIITHAPIKSVKLLERFKPFEKEGAKYGYRGEIKMNMKKKLTFLQAFLIGFAPLIFSFWLFFFLLELLFIAEFETHIVILLLLLMASIVLAAAPSAIDILNIPRAFQEDPKYSCYQIFLLIISIISVWTLSVLYKISFFHEIVYYLFIMMFYYGFKYGLWGINKILLDLISKRNFQKYSDGANESDLCATKENNFFPLNKADK